MTTRSKTADSQKDGADLVHTTETPAEPDEQPDEAGQGEKLYAVVTTLAGGQKHTELVAAESSDGLADTARHAFGVPEENVRIFEVRTV